MPALVDLKHNMRDLSTKALAVVEDEKKTTTEKREELDRLEPEIKSLSEQIADEEFLSEQRKRFAPTPDEDPGAKAEPEGAEVKSIGQQFIESDLVAELKSQVAGGVRWSTGAIEVKTTLTEGSGSGGQLVQPDVQPGIVPLLFQPLYVTDLIPSGTTGSNTVRYLKETSATNAASTVSEGETKPEATLVFAQVDEPVRKIAVTMKITDEMLEDYPQLRSYLDNRLTLFVNIEEELQLLLGTGVAPDVTGILNRSGLTAAQALGGDTGPDALYKEITKIRVASFLEPDAIVIHPNDWQTIRLLKDANNQYYGGGPFTGAYGNGTPPNVDSIWGRRVVITQNMTLHTALVGAFQTAAQIFRRKGLTLEATNSNEDDFKTNKIAIRAEQREALAVYRPAAFGTVTGLT